MKQLTALALLGIIAAVSALSEEMKEMAKMVHDQCVEESGAKEEMIENTKKGEFPEDQTLKCYLKCIYSNMGAISDEGELDSEAFSSILPSDMAYLTPIIEACKGVTGSDGCETAMNFNKCMYKTDPSKYLII